MGSYAIQFPPRHRALPLTVCDPSIAVSRLSLGELSQDPSIRPGRAGKRPEALLIDVRSTRMVVHVTAHQMIAVRCRLIALQLCASPQTTV